jgi:hypothetical protein
VQSRATTCQVEGADLGGAELPLRLGALRCRDYVVRRVRGKGGTVREAPEFQRAVDRLHAECRTRGLDLAGPAAEGLVAGLVDDIAERLRVKPATVVTTYLDGLDVRALADDVVQADAEQRQEIADASPAVISIERTGRLVAALAQAVRCVSLNHEHLAGEPDGKWHGIGVLDDAGNGLTLLGDALGRHHRAPQGVAILWSDEAVVLARRALSRTIANLRAGSWSFGHGREFDTQVAARMEADLAFLPQ